jgi:hypothetical protein
VSTLVLALYVQSDLIAPGNTDLEIYWAIVPLVLFWQCRVWLATARGAMHDDPIVYAARDWLSWVIAAIAVGIVTIARLTA